MARQLQQLATIQAAFAARIQQKVTEQRDDVQERAEDVPLVGWLLKPVAGFLFDLDEGSRNRKGDRGEENVLESLLRGLPPTWLIFHNVVVEPRPDEFAQIDLLAISYAGVFLIETKAWQGSFKAYYDNWQIRAGPHWNKVDSPTKQVQRQMRRLMDWLGQHRLPDPRPAAGWMMPTVVFTKAEWLSVKQCSVPVFDGQRDLVAFLKAQPEGVLTAAQINQLCHLIVQSPAVPQQQPVVGPSPAAHPTILTISPLVPSLSTPDCPKCHQPMVVRTASRGSTAGQQFYGCRNYPTCREIQPFQQATTPAPSAAPAMPNVHPTPSSHLSVSAAPAVPSAQCTACQREISASAIFCQYCGARV